MEPSQAKPSQAKPSQATPSQAKPCSQGYGATPCHHTHVAGMNFLTAQASRDRAGSEGRACPTHAIPVDTHTHSQSCNLGDMPAPALQAPSRTCLICSQGSSAYMLIWDSSRVVTQSQTPAGHQVVVSSPTLLSKADANAHAPTPTLFMAWLLGDRVLLSLTCTILPRPGIKGQQAKRR